jgi:hypothetical protein
MKLWTASKDFLAVLLCASLTLGGLWLLERGDLNAFAVPDPGGVAEQYVRALIAGRTSGAMQQLASTLRDQTPKEALRARIHTLQRVSPQDAHAIGAALEGTRAQARVRVRFYHRPEEIWTFPMIREQGLWRVAARDPM